MAQLRFASRNPAQIRLAGTRRRRHYPAEGLTGAGSIAGRWVPCVTTALQLHHHLGYPPIEHDLHDVRALAARFRIAVPPGWRAD